MSSLWISWLAMPTFTPSWATILCRPCFIGSSAFLERCASSVLSRERALSGPKWSLFSLSQVMPMVLWPTLKNRPFVVSSNLPVWMEGWDSKGEVRPRLRRQFLKATVRLGFLSFSGTLLGSCPFPRESDCPSQNTCPPSPLPVLLPLGA